MTREQGIMPLLSRRRFLGAAVAAFAVAPGFPAAARRRPRWFEDLAVNAFGIRSQLVADLPDALRRVRAMGYRRLELVSFKGWDGHPYGSFTALAGLSGQAVSAALSAAGLRANSSHVLPRELTPEALPRTLEWMRPIGVNTLIVAGLPIGRDKSEDFIRALDGLNETGQRLSGEGFRLMLHGDFVIWDRYRTGSYFDEFVRRVDPACCKLQLDLGATLQMGVDPRDVVRSHGAHLGSVHLRDGKPPFDPKTYVPSAALDEGVAPISGVVEDSLRGGIEDFVVEMVMRPEGGEFAALARSRAFLSRLPVASADRSSPD